MECVEVDVPLCNGRHDYALLRAHFKLGKIESSSHSFDHFLAEERDVACFSSDVTAPAP